MGRRRSGMPGRDRKSTRLNSSHMSISYAVFCLKKKINKIINTLLNKKKKKNIDKRENTISSYNLDYWFSFFMFFYSLLFFFIFFFFFFFNDTATTEIYTLFLHDALPIFSATTRRNLSRHPHSAKIASRGPPNKALNSRHGEQGAQMLRTSPCSVTLSP